MDEDEKLRRLAGDWNEAWNSRDAARLAAFLSADGTYYEPELDTGAVGPDGLVEIAARTWADWPTATFSIRSLTVEAPRVVVEWQSSATHKSGKIVNLEGVDILECEGDRIRSARVYYDVHTRAAALGL